MASTKGRVYNGIPPYKLELRNNGNLIHTVTGNDDRLSITDNYINSLQGILSFKISDATNKSNSVDIDKVSWNFMKNHHAGLSVTNGNFQNHLDAINESANRGIKYLGVVYAEDDIKNDSDLISLGNSGEYNHKQYHSTYLKGFDKVLSTAYARGVQLKVGISIPRGRQSLNNGTTRTLFFDESDAQLREDGTPTSRHNDFISAVVTGSYVRANVKNFVYTLFKNFTKRYIQAILDGTIIAYGVVTQDTAEEEFQYLLRDTNNQPEREWENGPFKHSKGDFQPIMVNGFKSGYPQYSSLTNQQIANSLVNFNENELGNRWRKYMEGVRAKFIIDMIDETISTVPALKQRTKFYQYDSSSLIIQLSRGNASAFQRFHPTATLIVKSNDVSGAGAFEMDYNVACARSVNAVCMVEPTPGGTPPWAPPGTPYESHDFFIYRGEVDNLVQLCKARGIHLSWVTNNWTVVDSLNQQHGLLPLQVPKELSVFKTENNRLVTKRITKNLSDIYRAGYGNVDNPYGDFKSEYYNYLAQQNLSAADILIKNDVSVNIEPPVDPPIPQTEDGVLKTIIGNKTYRIINPRYAKAEVLSNGAIKLSYEEFSISDQGNNPVKAWLLYSQLDEVPINEITQLRSNNGLVLPDGNHTFYIYYANTNIVTNYNDISPNVYNLFLNPATQRINSKDMEMIFVEIKSNLTT